MSCILAERTASAASQTGEIGYVKHDDFLFSDTAMQNKSHAWEANDITCTDTSYDNFWHKTAPIKESAIYTAAVIPTIAGGVEAAEAF